MLGALGGARLGNHMDEEQARGFMGAFMVTLSPLIGLGTLLNMQKEDCDSGGGRLTKQMKTKFAQASTDNFNVTIAADDESTGEIEEVVAAAKHWTANWQPECLWQEAQLRGPIAVGQLLVVGTLVGAISGTLGVGATPVMIAYLALNKGPNLVDEYKTCVGTALVAVTPNVTTGSLSHTIMGSTQWRMVPILGVGTAFGALCGSSIALYLPNALMQQVFAVFCAATGFGMLRKAPFLKKLVKSFRN